MTLRVIAKSRAGPSTEVDRRRIEVAEPLKRLAACGGPEQFRLAGSRPLPKVCYGYNIPEMTVHDSSACRWLLLVFSLPAKRASERVAIWRKLQRYGVLPLGGSGYVLPNSAANLERMEWLATSIRSAKGQASVVQAHGFDDLPDDQLRQRFQDARSRDYQKILHEAKKIARLPATRNPAGQLSRLRRRFSEIQEIDFFGNPLRDRVEVVLARADESQASQRGAGGTKKAGEFTSRIWMTRPRPGIDRVSSAWLIRRFIDAKAKFVFAADPSANPDAIPFDMFCAHGFGHRGDDCTFETLTRQFAIRDHRVKRIAEIIHDADIGDEKFGRAEGLGLDRVLIGWGRQELPDDELLKRGMDLIDGLYEGLARS